MGYSVGPEGSSMVMECPSPALRRPEGSPHPCAGRTPRQAPSLSRSVSCTSQAMPVHREPRKNRWILCFGDSLTAGFYNQGKNFEPYGDTLKRCLNEMGIECDVMIMGVSGHTAAQMVSDKNASEVTDVCNLKNKGLCRFLDEQEDKPDFVLIMAGTNDLGYNHKKNDILRAIIQLHSMCHHRGIKTIAFVPPCHLKQRQCLAECLMRWGRVLPLVALCIDPEEAVPRVGTACPLWEPDAIHLSPAGSRALGQRLAQILAPLLGGS